MRHSALRYALLAAVVMALLPLAVEAAAKHMLTTIHVQNMHCATCASKISRKLYAVQGVVKVTTNVQADTAVVTPQPAKLLSPRALWEAVEKAGFKPLKIEGPSGKFTAKPKA